VRTFDDKALLRVLDGPVDVLEGVGRDQLVERKPTLPVEIDERRNEQQRNAVTLDDAAHLGGGIGPAAVAVLSGIVPVPVALAVLAALPLGGLIVSLTRRPGA
jgi:hypothetical protein